MWGQIIGGLAGGAASGLFGGKDKTEYQPTQNSSWLYEQFGGQLGGLVGGLLNSNLPEQETADYNKYMEGMGSIMGTVGQNAMDTLSGKGQANRYQALQDLNATSAQNMAGQLGGQLNKIGLGASATGTSNSSRRGVAEGVATGAATAALNQQQAAQNQAFLQNEQKLQQQAIGQLSGLSQGIKQMMGMEEQKINKEYIAELMNSNPSLANLLLFQMGAGGLAGLNTVAKAA